MSSIREEWKSVVAFESKFEVSSHGRVKALPWDRRHWCGRDIPQPESIVKQSRHSGGYRVVSLRDGKKHFVHKLVMGAFVGPANGRDVNHINGDKSDNRLENLEYCDRLYNVRHAVATGLQDNAGESNGMNKYEASAIVAAHRMVQGGSTYAAASRATGVSEEIVRRVASGKMWKCLGLPTIAVLILALLLAHRASAQVLVVSEASIEPPMLPAVVEPPIVERPKPRAKARRTVVVPAVAFDLLQRHNAERAGRGLHPYRLNLTLTNVAQDCANYAARAGTFTHFPYGRPVEQRLRAAGYSFRAAGENGAGDVNDPTWAWLFHPGGHRDAVLHPVYTEAGFAVAYRGREKFWCAVYARPWGA